MNRFEKEATTWDDAPHRIMLSSAIAKALIESIPLNKELTVLDYGAGTGLITLEISKKVKHIVAMDSAEGMLRVLQEKIKHFNIQNISTVRLDLEKSKLTSTFDVIFSSMTMHHIEDPQKLIHLFIEALNPGGILAIVDLDSESGHFHSTNLGVQHFGFDRVIWKEWFLERGLTNVQSRTAYSFEKETAKGIKDNFSLFLITAIKQ